MRRKKKAERVLGQFGETLTTQYGKAERIVLDTGRQKGKYRIVADLKRKLCPECRAVHYSSLPEKTCLGCTQILREEKANASIKATASLDGEAKHRLNAKKIFAGP